MLSVEEAREQLLGMAPEAGIETVPLADALGRALAAEVIQAPSDVPPFANAAMDGDRKSVV